MDTIQSKSLTTWLQPQDEEWLSQAEQEAYQTAQSQIEAESKPLDALAARGGAGTAVALVPLHPAQQMIKDNASRFNAIRCGRRFGKDVLLQELLIDAALKSKPVAWFAPIYKDLMENWRDLSNTLHAVIVSANATEKRINLIGGGSIDMWSLDQPDSGRGRKYSRVVVNEASKVKDLQYSWEYVLRSTLADYGGDAFFGGTPKGFNYFAKLCKMHETEDNWTEFHFTTYDNPFIDRAEIDELKRTLPDRVFRQEIMAEFVEDGAFFQGVSAAAIVEHADTPEQHAGHTIVMGVDWALSEDFTVLTVACRQCNRVVDWLRFNQIDYRLQRERLMALAKKWNVATILAESNSIGQPNITELAYAGLPIAGFATTAQSKPVLIQDLQLALLNGFKIPVEYADEFTAFEAISLRDGKTRFSAPAGLHDDTVISTALVWQSMKRGTVLYAL